MNKLLSCVVKLVIGFASVAFLVVGASSTALGEEFYKGKTIRFVVGYSAGGGYDTYTRTIARHVGKHIPGNPITVVENMTGAGSLIAANYIYNKAKPDGLTVGVWNSVYVLYQALGDKKVKLDARKLGWIGAPGKGTPVCAIMGFTGLKTFKDVLSSKKPVKMGATRAGSILDDVPKILNRTAGTNFKVITGYKGTAKVRLAMQAREVDGACWTWESMRTTARAMLDAKGDDKLIPFIIHRKWDDPEVKDLPLIPKVIKGQDNRATYNAWVAVREFQTPFTVPPGTPKGRLNILRKAFKVTLEDPGFLADTRKSKLAIRYVSGEVIDKFVGEILGMSPKVKESLQFLVRKKKKKS
ncbi:MAG: Bug family tripartite tricarboxylate transporter substrate binding protein [Candidatus Binatia bacterium]